LISGASGSTVARTGLVRPRSGDDGEVLRIVTAIGLGVDEPAGGWGWQCGSSSFVAGNWGQFEPNNQGNEDCGAMGSGGSWADGDCGSSLRFVCELP
jgi:hypothetical protein